MLPRLPASTLRAPTIASALAASLAPASSAPGTEVSLCSFPFLCVLVPSSLGVCTEPLDTYYREQCGEAYFQRRYYYDQRYRQCRMFWYDNCQGVSRNVFPDLDTCRHFCERGNGVTIDPPRAMPDRHRTTPTTGGQSKSSTPSHTVVYSPHHAPITVPLTTTMYRHRALQSPLQFR